MQLVGIVKSFRDLLSISIIAACLYILFNYTSYKIQGLGFLDSFGVWLLLLPLAATTLTLIFENRYISFVKVWLSGGLYVLIYKLWETEINFLDLVFSKWSIKVIRIWGVDERLAYLQHLAGSYLPVFRPTDAQLVVMAQRSQTMEQVREELLSFVDAKILALQEVAFAREHGSVVTRMSLWAHEFVEAHPLDISMLSLTVCLGFVLYCTYRSIARDIAQNAKMAADLTVAVDKSYMGLSQANVALQTSGTLYQEVLTVATRALRSAKQEQELVRKVAGQSGEVLEKLRPLLPLLELAPSELLLLTNLIKALAAGGLIRLVSGDNNNLD